MMNLIKMSPTRDGGFRKVKWVISILPIGKVTDIHLEEKEPLVFFNGKYRALAEV
ncbi:hypothetical protein AB7942_23495 [Neobacillus sp. BF23-41]|uniref:hypothetical protein n=1 Tax=Neobacillus sp. BF23-41 TaxID=3240280 RepID=UPI0034E5A323